MSKLLSMMMSSSGGGGGTVGTPVDTTKTISVDGNQANYMAYKDGKYWFLSSRTQVSYSENEDLSSATAITLHTGGSTVIYGKNINIALCYASGKTTIDIYDNSMTYIRTIEKSGTAFVGGNNRYNYITYNGYIYVLNVGLLLKIEDSASVNDFDLITMSDNAYMFGYAEGNEVLITCNKDAGEIASKYTIIKYNLETNTVVSTSNVLYDSYSQQKASNCVKFKDKYYFTIKGTTYVSDDLITFTSISYSNSWYRIIPYGDVCYTVSKTGIYVTEDFNSSTLFQATTTMTSDETYNFRTGEFFSSAVIFCYSTSSSFECVIAPIE